MSRNLTILFLCGALTLAGCGGREARPIAESSDLDDRLSCEHLQGERATNTARIAELAKESENRHGYNVAMVVGFGLIGAMMMDSGESYRLETEALNRRNARLDTMMTARACPQAAST